MNDAQMEDGFVAVAREIWDEMLCRKLTERQQKVIKLIIRLSYGCGKNTAHIPMLKHFELCGVRIQDAKKTIDHLINHRVIVQSSDDEYSVNRKLSEWDIPIVNGWDEAIYKNLIHNNLKKITKKVSDSEIPSYTKSNYSDDESYTKGNYSENGVTKSVSSELPKVEVRMTENACGTKVEGVSKDSIKDINRLKTLKPKDSSSSPNKKTTYSEDNKYYQMAVYFHNKVMEHAVENRKDHLIKNANLQRWADEFRKIIELDKRDASELKSVIDWATSDSFWQVNILSPSKLRGDRYVQLAMRMDHKPNTQTHNKNRQLSQNEMLMREIEEEMERDQDGAKTVISDYQQLLF